MLTPYLTGAAQTEVDTLPVVKARDYELVRRTIMSTLNIMEETYRMRMRAAIYSQEKGPWWLANVIRANGIPWLKPTERSVEEVVELVWMEQFVAALPQSAKRWVMCNNPRTLEEAVRLMESFDTTGRATFRGSSEAERKAGGGGRRRRQRHAPRRSHPNDLILAQQMGSHHGKAAAQGVEAGDTTADPVRTPTAARGDETKRGVQSPQKQGACLFLLRGKGPREVLMWA